MKRPSKLSAWWWSLEGHRWLAVRVLFLIAMVPPLFVYVLMWTWREVGPDIKDCFRDTLKGPRRS